MNKFLNKHEYNILFIVTTLFILSMFFMLFSSVCYASSPDGTLPYIVPNMYDLNDSIPLDIITSADDLVRNTYNLSDSDTVLWFIDTYDIVVDDLGEYGYNSISFLINPFTRGYSESFNYLDSSIILNYQQGGTIEFKWTGFVRGPYGFGGSKSLLGSYTTTSISHGSITRLYPFYMSGSDVLGYSINDGGNEPIAIIFTNTVPFEPVIPGHGHATPPINNTGHYIPNVSPQKPNITPFNPTLPKFPNVDNSNTDSLLESLISIVVYGFSFNGDLLKDSVNYITGTLSDLVDYIVDSINRAQNNIIGAIQDFAYDFYNNMVSLFEPVSVQLAYITQEVDSDLITEGIQNTSLHNDYSSIVGVKDSFVSVFTDTQEPSTFVIPVHLEEISILNTPIQYIDLSIINPVKTLLRTFAWVLTTFSLVVTVLDSIPGYVNGGADE